MNEQETTADIIAEMDRVKVCTDGEPCLRDYARRFKAALKREKAAIEADALAVGGIVEAERRRSVSYLPQLRGDAAKLREALVRILGIADHLQIRYGLQKYAADELQELKQIAAAALTEPVRNCDVGSPKEQNGRYNKFCHDHCSHERCCGDCPLNGEPCCELAWAQKPYVEKEGGAK